jgi:3-deoxy-D-manno-octulosonic-acid transferase
LVLDSIGELPILYQLADLVFIGGSLVAEGGQNVIEPAACGKPILFGPHMENFRQVAEVFVDAGAAVQVDSVAEFEDECRDLLKRRARALELGRRAMKVVHQNRGAVKRTVGIIQRQLQNKNCPV